MRDHELPAAPRWIAALSRAANDAPPASLPSAWTRAGSGFARRAPKSLRPERPSNGGFRPEPPSAA